MDSNMPAPSRNFLEEERSTFDIIMDQRRFNQQQMNQLNQNQAMGMTMQHDPKQSLAPELERQFQVFIVHGENAKKNIQKMRDIKSNQIGSLVLIKGIVTRASDVKPCI